MLWLMTLLLGSGWATAVQLRQRLVRLRIPDQISDRGDFLCLAIAVLESDSTGFLERIDRLFKRETLNIFVPEFYELLEVVLKLEDYKQKADFLIPILLLMDHVKTDKILDIFAEFMDQLDLKVALLINKHCHAVNWKSIDDLRKVMGSRLLDHQPLLDYLLVNWSDPFILSSNHEHHLLSHLTDIHPAGYQSNPQRFGEIIEERPGVYSLMHPAMMAYGESITKPEHFGHICTLALALIHETYAHESFDNILDGRNVAALHELSNYAKGKGEFVIAVRLHGRLHVVRKGKPVIVAIGRGTGSPKHSDDEASSQVQVRLDDWGKVIKDDDDEVILHPITGQFKAEEGVLHYDTIYDAVEIHEDVLLVMLSSAIPARMPGMYDILGLCLFTLEDVRVILDRFHSHFPKYLCDTNDMVRVMQVIKRVRTPSPTPKPKAGRLMQGVSPSLDPTDQMIGSWENSLTEGEMLHRGSHLSRSWNEESDTESMTEAMESANLLDDTSMDTDLPSAPSSFTDNSIPWFGGGMFGLAARIVHTGRSKVPRRRMRTSKLSSHLSKLTLSDPDPEADPERSTESIIKRSNPIPINKKRS